MAGDSDDLDPFLPATRSAHFHCPRHRRHRCPRCPVPASLIHRYIRPCHCHCHYALAERGSLLVHLGVVWQLGSCKRRHLELPVPVRQPTAGLLPLVRHCVTVVLCLQGQDFEACKRGAGV